MISSKLNPEIFKIRNNELLSKYNSTKVFKVLGADLEQKSTEEASLVYAQLSLWINQLSSLDSGAKDKAIYRFFNFSKEIYVETNREHYFSSFPFEIVPDLDASVFQYFASEMSDFYTDAIKGEDYFKINGIYFRCISLYDLPIELGLSQLSGIGDYVLSFLPYQSLESKKMLEFNRRLHYSNTQKHIRDIHSEHSFAESEKLLEEIALGAQQLFKVECVFIVRANSIEALAEETRDVTNKLVQIGARPIIETDGTISILSSIFPGNLPKFYRDSMIHTDYLTCLVPFHSELLMDEGIEFYSRSLNPICFDLFHKSATNYNSLISGTTGSGKSFIAQKILSEELDRGSYAIVLDLGHSFKKLSEARGGVVFSLKFNPFQYRNPHYLKEFIFSFIPQEEASKKQEGEVFAIIVRALGEDIQTFKGLIETIDKEGIDIAPYFEQYWQYFTDEIVTENVLTYIDTSIYPDDLIGPLIIFLLEYFKNLNAQGKSRIFIFDECWSFLEKNASYISEQFRTLRKHNASAVALVQNMDDLNLSPLGRVILQNTFHKFILKQECSENEFLNSFDLERIGELNSVINIYSEIYYKSANHKKILRYYPTSHELALFSSNKKFNEKLESFSDALSNVLTKDEIIRLYSMVMD